ncbi:MAG TPA: hypothetical protein VNN12_09180 [Dehalococcoidia bacterium]|nr:hypothetical protein [Dehalococcoidia bacterium]
MALSSFLRWLFGRGGREPRPGDLVRLTDAPSEPEGRAWVELLAHHGIPAMGRPTHPYGAPVGWPGAGFAFEIWVRRGDFVRAAEILGLHPESPDEGDAFPET